jgi:rhodanese-related sulfurtransferase
MRPTSEEPSEDIDVPMLKTWLGQGMAVLVDVREPAEHAKERIPGARLMPLSTLVPTQVLQESGKRLVFHCVMGTRSAQACQKMREAGVPKVYNLQGGLQAWKTAGYRTESAAPVTMSPQRQGQVIAGALVLLGTVCGAFVSPWFLLLSGVVGAGLAYAGITGTNDLATLLARLLWKRQG